MTNASDIVTAQDFSWAAVDKQGKILFRNLIFFKPKKQDLSWFSSSTSSLPPSACGLRGSTRLARDAGFRYYVLG